jgi:PAS domain S-box-containing protein
MSSPVATWNNGAERIKGYKSDEIVGQHFSVFYTEEDRLAGEPAKALQIAIQNGKHESEGWRVRKDGTRFWASCAIDPVHDEHGALVGFAKVTRDVTERMKAQEELERTRAAFAQSQKMEAVGQLTGGIAHDFNNLLTVIANSLDLLGRATLDERRKQRILESARRATERGARLTQQLLAFARKQPLRPQPNDLEGIILRFESVLRRAVGESVDVELVLAKDQAQISANIDAPQFEAALLNLAVNARDAMPRGGTLTVTTGLLNLDSEQASARVGLKPGKYAAITVRDTGTGMSPHVQARAFEPFFTTKEAGTGSGLGLSQVYGFVAQSGGAVDLQSQPEAGTTVTLYLPAVSLTQSTSEQTEMPAAQRGLGTVLVVEDDPEVLDVTVETLETLGYRVLTASDGPSALSVLRRGDPIDILFTDIVMPKGMNGVELAHQARQLRADLSILLASGYPMSALSSDLGMAREFEFLSKPYRWNDLADKLRAVRSVH